MSDDLRAELRDARARVRALGARALARQEEAERELARLEPEVLRVRLEAEAARASGPAERAAQYAALLQDFEARLTALRGERALAAQSRRELDEELRALDRADREVLVAPVRAALAPDPFARSAEEIALANVRGSVAELDADALLEAELNPAAPAPAPPAAASPEEQARAELAALKAKRKPRGPTM